MWQKTLWRAAIVMAVALTLFAAITIAREDASTAVVVVGGVAALLCLPLIPIALLRWIRPPTTTMMLITRRRLSRESARADVVFTWVDLNHIARTMWLAAVAAEDAYFRFHSGFDWESIQDARTHNRTHTKKRGASTITQQVAKNLFLWPGRSYVRKGLEAYLTILIEALWPKQRILEVYLNVAQFGEDVFGVEAAARRFFRKPAAALEFQEAGLLAAALPSPRRYHVDNPSHELRFRQSWVLAATRRLGDAYFERP